MPPQLGSSMYDSRHRGSPTSLSLFGRASPAQHGFDSWAGPDGLSPLRRIVFQVFPVDVVDGQYLPRTWFLQPTLADLVCEGISTGIDRPGIRLRHVTPEHSP